MVWGLVERIFHKNFQQDFRTKISHKIFLQEFPTRFSRKIFHRISHRIFCSISHNNFPQDFPTRFSSKIFLQDFPELDPDWFTSHHPIPNAKLPPITAFLKLAFSPPPCPARFSCKNFPQEFHTRFPLKIFLQDFPELDPDCLAPHHPIPNAKFPPITALLNMTTYHKSAKVSPQPFPQILWEPQINE